MDKKQGADNFDYLVTNRDARRASNHRKLIIILLIIILLVLLLGGAAYAIVSLIQYNSFRAVIEKQGANIFSLSYGPSFNEASSALSFGGPRYLDNVTFIDVQKDIEQIANIEGSYSKNTEQYIALTFYFKNVSKSTYRYKEVLRFDDVTRDIDDTVRVALIRNDEITIYAKPRADGTPEEVVPGQNFTRNGLTPRSDIDSEIDSIWYTEPFFSDVYAFYNTGLIIEPGEVVKYTFLFWIEGYDAETKDNVLGGSVRMEMQFSQWLDE
ncbi:MAG: hypothetical protein LBF12_03920 [Christensenellaceae bacterium]|nr:hypothetical protein [Christensenellaceae bacterium]